LEAKEINRRWTPVDINYLQLGGERGLREIANQLDRDMSDTSKRAIILGKPFREIKIPQ
jgi:hypothetical protein